MRITKSILNTLRVIRVLSCLKNKKIIFFFVVEIKHDNKQEKS